MKKIGRSLRLGAIATTGLIAGAAIQYRFPIYENVEKRLKQWMTRESKSVPPPQNLANTQELEKSKEALNLPYLSDQVFETTDDMLVFMFPSEELYLKQTDRVRAIVDTIKAQSSQADKNLSKVKIFFSIVPPKDKASLDKVSESTVEIMCYKGQRKLRTSLPDQTEVPIDTWETFFTFKSTPVDEELKPCVIEHISGTEFEEKVFKASSREKPLIVQVYEKSCFLCFLMRPFLNSVATVLSDDSAIPFVFKRLDIDENDFPPHLPVVRGTPTFIKFQGPGIPPERFEEFKPRDLVNRICKDYPVSRETRDKLFSLVDKMTLRFQTFSGLVMWSTESEKIRDLIAGDTAHNATIPFNLQDSDDKDKEIFNRMVSEFMAEDMLKVDTLPENLTQLNKELTLAEKHAIMMGQILGEKVVELEKPPVVATSQ
jgi:hypothetical protein